ncbi:MAG TPA: DinB family protein [Longimicrobiales bacterium]|nr:DinB family protein [Longimicrobiales bacterium]
MATTRRLIERVPDDKGQWKPHPKSFSLAHLTQLVATMPGWWIGTLKDDHIDLATQPGYSNESTESLLQTFDQLVDQAREAIRTTKDEELDRPWELRMGDQVLLSSTKGETARQHMSHLAHHRGQLTVYLRMLDVPLPSIYGPTADSQSF